MVDADGVYRKVGPARVFTRESEAIAAIKGLPAASRSAPGDVLVLIGRGPMGAGMEEIYQITSALRHLSSAGTWRSSPTRGSPASRPGPASATSAPRRWPAGRSAGSATAT